MSRFPALIALLVFSQPVLACISMPAEEYQAAVERDLLRQAQLVPELTSEADAVLVADVAATSGNGARVQVVEYVKGSGAMEREVRPGIHVEAIGCAASAAFRNVELQPGLQYLLYLSGDRVLRADTFDRPPEVLPALEELELVRRSLRT